MIADTRPMAMSEAADEWRAPFAAGLIGGTTASLC